MRQFPLALALAALLGACETSTPALDASLAQVQKISAEKDSLLRDVVATSQFITAVNGELARVKGSGVDKPLVKGATDLADTLTPLQARAAVQARVAELVSRLNESESRLAASRSRVANLVKGNATAKAQLAAFDSTIKAFRVMVESQKAQVATLTDQVTALAAENATLRTDKGQLLTEKDQLSTEKAQLTSEKVLLTSERNTVYYIVGTQDELLKAHVIEMTGGFIGLGRTAVPARDLSAAAFTSIDRTQMKAIPFPTADRSYRIITRQDVSALERSPENSNEFKGSLKIQDAEKFWGASKYLIVVEN